MDLQREQLEGIKTPQNHYQGNVWGKQKLRRNKAIVNETIHAPWYYRKRLPAQAIQEYEASFYEINMLRKVKLQQLTQIQSAQEYS